MNPQQILKFCLENGLLVDKDVLNLFSETKDIESAKLIIEKIKNYTKQNIITKNVFSENREKVGEFLCELPTKNQKELENLKIKLGLSIEISRFYGGRLPRLSRYTRQKKRGGSRPLRTGKVKMFKPPGAKR